MLLLSDGQQRRFDEAILVEKVYAASDLASACLWLLLLWWR